MRAQPPPLSPRGRGDGGEGTARTIPICTLHFAFFNLRGCTFDLRPSTLDLRPWTLDDISRARYPRSLKGLSEPLSTNPRRLQPWRRCTPRNIGRAAETQVSAAPLFLWTAATRRRFWISSSRPWRASPPPRPCILPPKNLPPAKIAATPTASTPYADFHPPSRIHSIHGTHNTRSSPLPLWERSRVRALPFHLSHPSNLLPT